MPRKTAWIKGFAVFKIDFLKKWYNKAWKINLLRTPANASLSRLKEELQQFFTRNHPCAALFHGLKTCLARLSTMNKKARGVAKAKFLLKVQKVSRVHMQAVPLALYGSPKPLVANLPVQTTVAWVPGVSQHKVPSVLQCAEHQFLEQVRVDFSKVAKNARAVAILSWTCKAPKLFQNVLRTSSILF